MNIIKKIIEKLLKKQEKTENHEKEGGSIETMKTAERNKKYKKYSCYRNHSKKRANNPKKEFRNVPHGNFMN